MPSRRSAPAVDYRASESEGRVSSSWSFDGPEGIERLDGPGEIRVPVPPAFSARLIRIRLDHVALERLRCTPHRFTRSPTPGSRTPSPPRRRPACSAR